MSTEVTDEESTPPKYEPKLTPPNYEEVISTKRKFEK